jgi:triacylglycerol lipase
LLLFRLVQYPPARSPIVLVHGYFGFDVLKVMSSEWEYFRGVRRHLEGLGHEVHVARVASFGAVRERAEQLAAQIEEVSPKQRVHVIAHSMGGLDARYAIAHLGLEHRIATLTTIGTPHRGTPLADGLILQRAWRFRWLARLLGLVSNNHDGLADLTTRKMAEFNRSVVDSPRVLYRSIVGALSTLDRFANPLLWRPHAYLLRAAGVNDGLVPASSQRWGGLVRQVEADHIALAGWSSRFDARRLYGTMAHSLAAHGL